MPKIFWHNDWHPLACVWVHVNKKNLKKKWVPSHYKLWSTIMSKKFEQYSMIRQVASYLASIERKVDKSFIHFKRSANSNTESNPSNYFPLYKIRQKRWRRNAYVFTWPKLYIFIFLHLECLSVHNYYNSLVEQWST